MIRQPERNKDKEMDELFNAVVNYELHPGDPLYAEIMREQKNKCLIVWPEDTVRKCKAAIVYAANVKLGRVKCQVPA